MSKKKNTRTEKYFILLLLIFGLSATIIESGHEVMAAFIFTFGFLILGWMYLKLNLVSSRTWKIKYWNLWDKSKLILFIVLVFSFVGLATGADWLNELIEWFIVFGLIWFFIAYLRKGIRFLTSLYKPRTPSSFAIEEIDKMDGIQFEITLEKIYDGLGYFAELTPFNDFGADVIIIKSKEKTVIQAKRYGERKTVGVAAINEVVGACGYYNAHKKIAITNRYFTKAAKETAKRNNVKLIDREGLVLLLKEYRHNLDQNFLLRFTKRPKKDEV